MATLKGDGKMIFLITIGAILALAFMTPIANSVVGSTDTISVTNNTVTSPAVNSTAFLNGRSLEGTMLITNTTNADITSQFDTTNKLNNGLLSVAITANDTTAAQGNTASPINVTYTAQPDGYLSDGGARSTLTLVIIISALAILFVVIQYLFDKDTSFSKMLMRG